MERGHLSWAHRHQHSFQWEPRPQTLAWASVVTWPQISTQPLAIPGRTSATARSMGLRWLHMPPTTAACPLLPSSKAQGHHQDLQGTQQRHRVHTPTRISDFIPAWGSNRDHRCQHGFQWHPDHGVLQGGPIQNLSPSQASIIGQSQADPEAESVSLTLLGNDSLPVSVLSLTCHHHCVSSSPSLHGTHWSIFPSSLLSTTSLIIVSSTRQGQRSLIL